MEALGSPRPRRSPTMKNFARLVRFAWPYRVRFGLSLACAVLVAVLWGANIGAVYPLLKILFYSENCQKWVAEKIESTDDRGPRRSTPGSSEVDFLEALGDPADRVAAGPLRAGPRPTRAASQAAGRRLQRGAARRRSTPIGVDDRRRRRDRGRRSTASRPRAPASPRPGSTS